MPIFCVQNVNAKRRCALWRNARKLAHETRGGVQRE
jgi:hypothetical protein